MSRDNPTSTTVDMAADLTPSEIEHLRRNPLALQLLIDHHDYQSSAGEAMGFCVQANDDRRAYLSLFRDGIRAANGDKPGDLMVVDLHDYPREQPHEPCGWQPIETAPEGEAVLTSGFIRNQEPQGRWRVIACRKGDCWNECTAEADQSFGDLYPPTHWMPLPPIPTSGSTKGEKP